MATSSETRSDGNSNGKDGRGAALIRPLMNFQDASSWALRDAMSSSDEVSSVAFHASLMLIGTRCGFILELDAQERKTRVVSCYQQRVHSLSIELSGAYFASGCADGYVRVAPHSSQSTSSPWDCLHSPNSAVLAVVLCPEYASGQAGRHLVCSGSEDGQLCIHKRSLQASRTVIHHGEGPVTHIAWRGALIAWANDRGVKVYNERTHQKVTYVPRIGGPSAIHRCLTWAFDDRLMIGWGHHVTQAFILSDPSTTTLSAEVRSFECAAFVYGLAPVADVALAVLTCGGPPHFIMHVRVCTFAGETIRMQEVPLQQSHAPHIQLLAYAAPHLPMYAITPRDLVSIRIADFLDHAMQLIEDGNLDEAVLIANLCGNTQLCQLVCMKCITPLLKKGQDAEGEDRIICFQQACAAVTQFKQLEAGTWQQCIYIFEQFNALQYFAVNVPVPPILTLPIEVYDQVLQRLVSYPKILVTVLHWWPITIFSVGILIERLKEQLPSTWETFDVGGHTFDGFDVDSRCRIEALARLEAESSHSEMAVKLFLGLGNTQVFHILRKSLTQSHTCEQLLRVVRDNIQRLFEIDDGEACKLLVEKDCYKSVSVDSVVAALQDCDTRWQHDYLKSLFEKDELAGQAYHMLMIRLYAEFEPKSLADFLTKTERYNMDEAIKTCHDRGLYSQEAYLEGKRGHVDKALDIYLDKMGDIKSAVEHASKTQDPKLWEKIVDFVLKSQIDNPKLLIGFLETLENLENANIEDVGKIQAPFAAQPASVLKRLPQETPVLQVAAPVRRVFDVLALQESLYQSCRSLAKEEITRKQEELSGFRKRGVAVKIDARDGNMCDKTLSERPIDEKEDDLAPAVSTTGKGFVVAFAGKGNAHLSCERKVAT